VGHDLAAEIVARVLSDLQANDSPLPEWAVPWKAVSSDQPLRANSAPHERFEPVLSATIRRVPNADAFFARIGARMMEGNSPAYIPMYDAIVMPPIEAFGDSERYYMALAHEYVHWTQARGRLNRDLGRKERADEGHAREELVAELGAAILCAELGIELEYRREHSAFIASWFPPLTSIDADIIAARAHAEAAVAYLKSLQSGHRAV